MATKSAVARAGRSWQERLLFALPLIGFLAIWQLLPYLGGLFEDYIVPPTQVLGEILVLARTGDLWTHIAISFRRAFVGFVFAAVTAIPLGFVMGGWFRPIERAFYPILAFLGKLNPFSLFPLFVMILGIGEVSKTAIVMWVCLWPLLFRTISGVKDLDPSLVKAARGMGCGRLQLFVKVVVPGATPEIFSGLQMASSTSFFILVAAEMIGSTRGLGYLVWNAQMQFMIPRLFAATVTISSLGLAINWALKRVERHLLSWRPSQAV
ncbi:MAG: ABC transporter permease [Myxococcales bacterium]